MSLADDYPDHREPNNGYDTPRSRRKAKERAEAFAARCAAMPRCRCGLLLPCVDCLPTNAVDFAAQRMVKRPSMVGPDDR
jgi:hypothetical protein